MDSVNKTLFIPLYGRALVSHKGIILKDEHAQRIWCQNKFKLKGKSKSKWLAYYMGMRSAVFDDWVKNKILETPNAVVLHLGCGLDSRVLRVGARNTLWVDVDFEQVIQQRKRFFTQTDFYTMLGADISRQTFVSNLPNSEVAIVVLEGVSMYITNDALCKTIGALKSKYNKLELLIDCYTPLAVKLSKIKNPVKDVGVNKVYGVAQPTVLENGTGIQFVSELDITPQNFIDQLSGLEKKIFKTLYAGKTAKKLYKLYQYKG